MQILVGDLLDLKPDKKFERQRGPYLGSLIPYILAEIL